MGSGPFGPFVLLVMISIIVIAAKLASVYAEQDEETKRRITPKRRPGCDAFGRHYLEETEDDRQLREEMMKSSLDLDHDHR